jgi:hypothetical protein
MEWSKIVAEVGSTSDSSNAANDKLKIQNENEDGATKALTLVVEETDEDQVSVPNINLNQLNHLLENFGATQTVAASSGSDIKQGEVVGAVDEAAMVAMITAAGFDHNSNNSNASNVSINLGSCNDGSLVGLMILNTNLGKLTYFKRKNKGLIG